MMFPVVAKAHGRWFRDAWWGDLDHFGTCDRSAKYSDVGREHPGSRNSRDPNYKTKYCGNYSNISRHPFS